ncbi:MAG: helix-turn-helix domain-containing protein [Patescibacteria group bacterium]|nr:helix-turn-helix domain-containing protein [Patescibacteria group bacterium]
MSSTQFISSICNGIKSVSHSSCDVQINTTRTVFIYALVDPFTYLIRYIGKTEQEPKKRLWEHCIDKSITYRTNWIRQVISKGKRPLLIILQVLSSEDDWKRAEIRWIKRGRNWGWPLTNCTSGGDGVPNLPPEIKVRIAKVWKGRKHHSETLKKIGDASRGRKHTEEHKEYMRHLMLGRKFTDAWKSKISKAVRKLTVEQVREIRNMLKEKFPQRTIAERFQVSPGTIHNINQGITYQDVE